MPEPSFPSDEALLGRYAAGDVDAFALLVERYERPLFNFILRSVRDRERAEDLLQDVFVRVVQNASSFKGDAKLSTWLYTIARNLCIDASRKMVFRRHRSLDAPGEGRDGDGAAMVERVAGSTPTADRQAIGGAVGEAIQRAVEELPEEQREVFLLREVEHLPFKEIAEIVGVPENTVKSRMRYALERLQEALSEYEDYARALG